MDGGGVSQLHGVLSSYTKAHFVARVPAARSNWEKLVAVQRRPACPWSCGALAYHLPTAAAEYPATCFSMISLIHDQIINGCPV